MDKEKTQLEQLAEPFPPALIKQPPRGKYGVYVAHSTVVERLLSIVGPFGYEIVQVIHGYAPAVKGGDDYTWDKPRWPAREHAVVGCVGRLTVEVDGRKVIVEEAGDVEAPAMELDGRNLKDASSDAIKRCAMRLGLGLHLWSQDDYFLDRQLQKDAAEDTVAAEGPTPEAEAVRQRYRPDTGTSIPGDSDQGDEPTGPPPDFPPGEGYDETAHYEPPVDEVVMPAVMSTDAARGYLEWEVALDGTGRMKCKESCERADVTKSDSFCCQDAHLRRLYQTAEVGLGLPHKRGFKDLLHQALAKLDASHVSDLKKQDLEKLIDNSKTTFTEMLYGPVDV
jgi:hypothetical protein